MKRLQAMVGIFDAGGKAILTFSNSGTCESSDLEDITKLRETILVLIHDVAKGCIVGTPPESARIVRLAMHDLHPRKYNLHPGPQGPINEKLICDLADICVTLRRVELQKKLSHEKVVEVRVFCAHMKDELTKAK